MPRGRLREHERLRLFDDEENEIPLQTDVISTWSDGSIQWLMLEFLLRQVHEDEYVYHLREKDQNRDERDRMNLSGDDNYHYVSLPDSTFALSNSNCAFTFHSTDLTNRYASARLLLMLENGEWMESRQTMFMLEEQDSFRTTLWVRESYDNSPLQMEARFDLFANTGLVRMKCLLRNPQPAQHPGGLWDLGDPGSVYFRGLQLQIRLPVAAADVLWQSEPGQSKHVLAGNQLNLVQHSSGGDNWNSRNHVNRHGKVPLTDRGYRVRTEGGEDSGSRANPLVSILLPDGELSVSMPKFWQQFPKAIQLNRDEGEITLDLQLFPSQEELYELQGGEQKTHEIWLHFGQDDDTSSNHLPLEWTHHPALVRGEPEWYVRCEVFPEFCTTFDSERGKLFLQLMEDAIDGPNNLLAKREIIDEYGWRNYGDLYADHEEEFYEGEMPLISHYNNQYDMIYGSLLQYLRTGDRRWWEIHESLSQHVIDIDIYHTKGDKSAYNNGMFWHTDHYQDASTSTHRAYTRSNKPPGQPYGGGPSNEHNYSTGLLYRYRITHDVEAMAFTDLADWVIAMDDGSSTLLGIVDDGPTGVATSTREPNYQGPGRGAGNSINTLLNAWLVTEEQHYLTLAETFVRRCIHPKDNLEDRDLLNIEDRWSYTVFLTVLARYLDVKAEMDQIDFQYAYARASLLHYAKWMAEHEQFYFDHPEKLDYPTSTWSAQEIRKANVLRLAARHADDPLRSTLIQRGQEFADRVWQDLITFDTRTTTRPLAIMMTEGMRDIALSQSTPESAPRPQEQYHFGEPEQFVPQKARVKALIKKPLSWPGIALKLLNPRRWLRYRNYKQQ